MTNNTANSNYSIGCSVAQCEYHCTTGNYCSLNKIDVGSTNQNPTKPEYTECSTFRAK